MRIIPAATVGVHTAMLGGVVYVEKTATLAGLASENGWPTAALASGDGTLERLPDEVPLPRLNAFVPSPIPRANANARVRLVALCAAVPLVAAQLAVDAAVRWFGVSDTSGRATLIGDVIATPGIVLGIGLAVRYRPPPRPTLPTEYRR